MKSFEYKPKEIEMGVGCMKLGYWTDMYGAPDMGHWIWSGVGPYDPRGCVGFCYVIQNKTTNRKYIGCKVYHFQSGKKVKQSDWRTHCGSNKQLQSEIEKYGKGNFSFLILSNHPTKTDMRYQEARLIIDSNAIYSEEFYNELLFVRIKHQKKV